MNSRRGVEPVAPEPVRRIGRRPGRVGPALVALGTGVVVARSGRPAARPSRRSPVDLGRRRRRVSTKSSQNLIRVEPLRRPRHGSVARANPAQHHREIADAVRGSSSFGGSNPRVAAPRREGAPPPRRLRPRRLLLHAVHRQIPRGRVGILGELNLAPNRLRRLLPARSFGSRLHLHVRRSDHDLSLAE